MRQAATAINPQARVRKGAGAPARCRQAVSDGRRGRNVGTGIRCASDCRIYPTVAKPRRDGGVTVGAYDDGGDDGDGEKSSVGAPPTAPDH